MHNKSENYLSTRPELHSVLVTPKPSFDKDTLNLSYTSKTNISTVEQVQTQEKKVINGMEFVSIQNETSRYYDVPTGKGGSTVRVQIEKPLWLYVRPSGSHTVISGDGYTHYIPSNFVHLAWIKKEGTDAAEF